MKTLMLNQLLLIFSLLLPASLLALEPVPTDSFLGSLEKPVFHDRMENYAYPFHDPYFATLTNLLFAQSEKEPLRISVPPLSGRMQVPLLEKRAAEFYVSAHIQPKPAPVIFLIPGFGSGPGGGKLGSELYKLGFSVISPPSPSHWLFVLAQSQHGMTGLLSEDARDLQRVLLQTVKIAQRQYGLQATSYKVIGFSMGASHAAHLWKLDRTQNHFHFQKVVLVNPPLNMQFSMQALDELYELGGSWSKSQQDHLWGKAFGYVEVIFKKMQAGENVIASLTELFPLKDSEIQFLIGDSFRRNLRDSIHVVQQIRNTGYFKTPASKYELNARLDEIKTVSFVEFMKHIAYPFWNKRLQRPANWSYEDFQKELNMESLIPELTLDPGVYFISNSNDFITKPAVSYNTAVAFGQNGYLYAYGGHCGNLWFPTNTEDLKNVLK